MSVDSDNACVLLSPRDSRSSCVFRTADEKDDLPEVGEESVLEMLSYSKFSDLETWLCMPSSLLLPRALDSTRTTSSSSSSSSHTSNHSSNSPPISSSSSPASNSRRSTCSESGEADTPLRSPGGGLHLPHPRAGEGDALSGHVPPPRPLLHACRRRAELRDVSQRLRLPERRQHQEAAAARCQSWRTPLELCRFGAARLLVT
ncbi:uncharacterized protein LOC119915425 isoform X2 [Micropterus salmoides]|nr:uncharacterized protein LOC119915425 isoform X2 [Micropterus salmoides]XP_038590886.1 uncharacterized protein LOC119915425 isoform X2 [Micropterus salmoides]